MAAPLFFTPGALGPGSLLAVAGGVVSFSALASAVYILNDYVDREADRGHPVKRARPLAAGAVSVPAAFALLAALFLVLAKRRDDLVGGPRGDHRGSLGGYTKPLLDAAVTLVLGALLIAYLICTTGTAVMARMGTTRLFHTAPFVVAGILRYLQITFVEERSGSPTEIVLTDRFLIAGIAGWA